jgi:hypothetical protein
VVNSSFNTQSCVLIGENHYICNEEARHAVLSGRRFAKWNNV